MQAEAYSLAQPFSGQALHEVHGGNILVENHWEAVILNLGAAKLYKKKFWRGFQILTGLRATAVNFKSLYRSGESRNNRWKAFSALCYIIAGHYKQGQGLNYVGAQEDWAPLPPRHP